MNLAKKITRNIAKKIAAQVAKEIAATPQIAAISRLFVERGFQIYLVGGSVRDFALANLEAQRGQKIGTKNGGKNRGGESRHGGKNRTAKTTAQDFDFATNATPSEIREVLEGHRLFLQGERFGSIGVVFEGVKCEITTFRSDGAYLDSRHPSAVRFLADLRGDLSRRDFAINALAYDVLGGSLIDYFDGLGALQRGEISCIGRAEARFSEDALRILRAFSFASRLDFAITPETLAAAKALAPSLRRVKIERVRCEVAKIMQGKNPKNALEWMKNCGILGVKNVPKNLNKIPRNARIYAAWAVFESLEMFEPKAQNKIKQCEEICARLGADLRTAGLAAAGLKTANLKMANLRGANLGAGLGALDSAAQNPAAGLAGSDSKALKPRQIRAKRAVLVNLANEFGLESVALAAEIFAALNPRDKSLKKALEPRKIAAKMLLRINGHDLENLGFAPRQIGAIKAFLVREVAFERLKNSRRALLKAAKRHFSGSC